MGGKTSQSSQQVQIPAAVMSQYASVNAKANNTAATPFQTYNGEFVAPIQSQQTEGIAGTNTYANAAQPYFGAATNTIEGAQAGTQPYNAGAENALGAAAAGTQKSAAPLTGQQIEQYLSPELQTVLGSTANVLNQNNQQQQAGQLGNAISSGAFGGDRTGIAAANLEEQQNLANSQIYSGIANQAYQSAGTAADRTHGRRAAREYWTGIRRVRADRIW